MDISSAEIILASASPRRRQLMEQVGICFKVLPSSGEEIIRGSNPSETVKLLSADKASEVSERLNADGITDRLVIGADTVVALDGRILGKPCSEENAFEMIKGIQGRSHSVITGVTVIYRGKTVSFAEETKVFVYPMSDDEITEYIARGESMDKAGAYGIQGYFARYVRKINGDYNNVVGLPVARLLHEIKKM